MAFVIPGPVFWVFLGFALPISIIDIRCMRIPDTLNLGCFALVFLLRLVDSPETLAAYLAAAAFGSLFLWIIRAAKGGLGLGDVKYAALLGLVCGFPGILATLFCASVLGIIAALAAAKGNPRAIIPFAPFLSAAALLTELLKAQC